MRCLGLPSYKNPVSDGQQNAEGPPAGRRSHWRPQSSPHEAHAGFAAPLTVSASRCLHRRRPRPRPRCRRRLCPRPGRRGRPPSEIRGSRGLPALSTHRTRGASGWTGLSSHAHRISAARPDAFRSLRELGPIRPLRGRTGWSSPSPRPHRVELLVGDDGELRVRDEVAFVAAARDVSSSDAAAPKPFVASIVCSNVAFCSGVSSFPACSQILHERLPGWRPPSTSRPGLSAPRGEFRHFSPLRSSPRVASITDVVLATTQEAAARSIVIARTRQLGR